MRITPEKVRGHARELLHFRLSGCGSSRRMTVPLRSPRLFFANISTASDVRLEFVQHRPILPGQTFECLPLLRVGREVCDQVTLRSFLEKLFGSGL